MYLTRIFFFVLAATNLHSSLYAMLSVEPKLDGELKKWHKVTLTFVGPETSETDAYNPFLNYRLDVDFWHEDTLYRVPGYFAADGNAAETGAEAGDNWRVHFTPDREGIWHYRVSFRKGSNVAVSEKPVAGESAGFMDGETGSFSIGPTDKSGRDLRSKGRLNYVGGPYLQFAETGTYFLKAGADAPENLLAYSDFDGHFASDGRKDELVKTWEPHIRDWKEGDPSWQGGKGKGLIGAINYLAEKGMNAFSFLPLTIVGDDLNVYPYIDYSVLDRMDVSKLDQWEIVFEHGTRKGMFLHFKLSEVENQGLLDNGDLGVQRKLYYRELIARFGHHLAMNWNIGEENGKWAGNHPTPWQTTTQRLAMARYFYDHDPYRHHVVVHNGQPFYDLLGPESRYTGLSLQTNREDFGNVHREVLRWRLLSDEAGRHWAVAVDEPGDHRYSLVPDAIDPDHDLARQNALWGALMAGAWGIEWYFGYLHEHSDLTCQDWRSRDLMWDQSRHALAFFMDGDIPFWKLKPNDELTSQTDDFVMHDEQTIVIYRKKADSATTITNVLEGSYSIQWYNPRTGIWSEELMLKTINGQLSIGAAPADPDLDWAILLRKRS